MVATSPLSPRVRQSRSYLGLTPAEQFDAAGECIWSSLP
jgi:hypothetical protein